MRFYAVILTYALDGFKRVQKSCIATLIKSPHSLQMMQTNFIRHDYAGQVSNPFFNACGPQCFGNTQEQHRLGDFFVVLEVVSELAHHIINAAQVESAEGFLIFSKNA